MVLYSDDDLLPFNEADYWDMFHYHKHTGET